MHNNSCKRLLFLVTLLVILVQAASAQKAYVKSVPVQSVVNVLSTLPEADVLIYTSPQKILNEAAPKVIDATEIAKMRSTFDDLKKSVGIDPSTIDYLVIAVRFHKPAADLSFVAPDVMTVFGGDFSSASLFETGKLYLQEKLRDETYGSKTISIMPIDSIAEAAVKNPLLKSFVEVGAVPLSANSIAVGNVRYLKAAIDAVDGKGQRLQSATLDSLLRDQTALISAAGSPLTSFMKSFGMLGTETTAREARCDTRFGDFYGAVTLSGTNFSVRGAMNTDNPDTAKIINNLVSGLWQQAIDSVPDKNAQSMLKAIRIIPRESELVWEADISDQTVANFIKEQTKPKVTAPPETSKPAPAPRQKPRRRKPRG
ncbi:MAG TPA: hypothetical protein VFH91_10950 [Pyrinomonadaceae bacterium]|nr:hypothetical protein [Pyrinomonadaceae bacterium]